MARSSKVRPSVGNRWAPLRFIAFLLAAFVLIPAAAWWLHGMRGVLVGFDVAATIFLGSCVPLLGEHDPKAIRRAAARNDANRTLLLVISVAVALVILVALSSEVDPKSAGDPVAILILVATLVLTWLFTNSVYALHYAHMFYSGTTDGGDWRGLDFPGTQEPDYRDFFYFAFTLGMTFQTSDVQITDRRLRNVTIGHALAAFWFNIGVLAFTINGLGR